MRDGEITGWQMTNLNAGSFGLAGPYRVAAQRLDYRPTESPLRQGSYRALAATANHFARESHMDELAAAAGSAASTAQTSRSRRHGSPRPRASP